MPITNTLLSSVTIAWYWHAIKHSWAFTLLYNNSNPPSRGILEIHPISTNKAADDTSSYPNVYGANNTVINGHLRSLLMGAPQLESSVVSIFGVHVSCFIRGNSSYSSCFTVIVILGVYDDANQNNMIVLIQMTSSPPTENWHGVVFHKWIWKQHNLLVRQFVCVFTKLSWQKHLW